MGIRHWVIEEAKSIALVTLYFASCFVMVMLLKQMWLSEYGITFGGMSIALFAALVTAKVVILLDKVPLIKWLRVWPGIVTVCVRTAVYTAAVLIVMLIEKAVESRAEHGGFLGALASVFDHPDMPNLLATTIAIGLSFLAYNAFAIVQHGIGEDRMRALFLSRKAPAT